MSLSRHSSFGGQAPLLRSGDLNGDDNNNINGNGIFDAASHGVNDGRGAAKGTGSPSNEINEDDIPIEQIRRYEDFSTVDWIQDSLRERDLRHASNSGPDSSTTFGRINDRMRNVHGIVGYLWRAFAQLVSEGQNWVVVTLVGLGIGVNAALISIITVWLSDIKMGHCTNGWWLSRKFCCLELAGEGEVCAEWVRWGGIEPFGYLVYVTVAALFALSAAHLVKSFAPYAAGSGISELKCIIGGFIINGFLSPWTLAIKSLTLPLAIASGLSIGKEGPSVHVACCVGNVISGAFSKFRNSHLKTREILTAASAAGVAVAFGSPIGGVLFAIEEMSHNFTNKTMWRSFVCALVATFTLSAMNPFRTGKLVLFQVSYDRDWHYFEIPFYILIGIFGGLYGEFVIKFNLQVAAFRRKHLAAHGIYEAVFLAVLSAIIGYLNRFLRMDMTEGLEILFKECEGGGDVNGLCQTSSQWQMVNSLLLATIIRIGLVVISYGCKVPAGIFVPSMAVGATFGRMVGIIAKAIHANHPTSGYFAGCAPDVPCITPGTYAFLGAAAALGGITRITVTVVVIMFELTGALTYILPTMIVLLVTKAVSDFFGGGGISDQLIRFNGYPFLEKEDKEDDDYAFIEPIVNVMKRDIIVIQADGMLIQEIDEIVQSTTYQGFPVIRNEDDSTIIGFVRRSELRYALDKVRRIRNISANAMCTFKHLPDAPTSMGESYPLEGRSSSVGGGRRGSAPDLEGHSTDAVDLGQYVDQTSLNVSPQLPLEIVMQMFRRMGPRVILVAREGKLLGLVTVKDVLRHEAAVEHSRARLRDSRNFSGDGDLNTAGGTTTPDWRNRMFSEDNAAGLEIILEAVLSGMKTTALRMGDLLENLADRFNIPIRRPPRGMGSRGPLRQEDRVAGEEFELGVAEN